MKTSEEFLNVHTSKDFLFGEGRKMKNIVKITLCNIMMELLLLTMTGCGSSGSTTTQGLTDEPNEDTTAISRVDISFQYQRMSTHASNQIAIWVEDSNGKLVRTILVTNFTARGHGYRNREDSLSAWVKAAKPKDMSDSEIDAISSAIPNSGTLAYSWDMTDNNGEPVPEGIYVVKTERTLYWSSNILYTAEINTEDTPAGRLKAQSVRSEPNNHDNENMITNFAVNVVR